MLGQSEKTSQELDSAGPIPELYCVCVPEINYQLVERKLIHNA